MKKIALIFFLLSALSYAREKNDKNRLDEIYEYDYFNHKYLYLDDAYKINIPHKVFQSQLDSLGIDSCRISSYYDSLIVINSLEFENKLQARCATRRLGYTWLRLGYHIWLSPSEAKKFAFNYGFSHPYLFKKYLILEQNKVFDDFYVKLENKINRKYPDTQINRISRSDFLDQALKLNPTRIDDLQKKKGKMVVKNSKKGCGKANCCQTRNK